MKPKKAGKSAEETDLQKDLVDDVTRKKIRKHLSDEKDMITDQDIRNVKIHPHKPKKINPTKQEEIKKKDDSEPENPPITPWNILVS